MRCLVLSCTKRKVLTPEPIPAIERYDGPIFRIIRRYLREQPEAINALSIWVLSAEYGLIEAATLIDVYDRRMTRSRAQELSAATVNKLRLMVETQLEVDLFVLLGKDYQAVLPSAWQLFAPCKVTVAVGGSGKKQQQLYRWLYGIEPDTEEQSVPVEQLALLPGNATRSAIIRGVTVTASRDEIQALITRLITKGDDGYLPTRDWVAQTGPYQVAPKWLVSRLSGVPVSKFAADEARRVLKQLGIDVIRRV